jgi:hypothetical protein
MGSLCITNETDNGQRIIYRKDPILREMNS